MRLDDVAIDRRALDEELDRTIITSRLMSLVEGLTPQSVVTVVHHGSPRPKARPGGFKGRRFTTREVREAERDLGTHLGIVIPNRPWLSNVALVAIFYRPTRGRCDLDNLMKLVMDSATKAHVWKDDCQVTAQACFIELDPERPRTVLAIAPTTSSLDRTVAGGPALPIDTGFGEKPRRRIATPQPGDDPTAPPCKARLTWRTEH